MGTRHRAVTDRERRSRSTRRARSACSRRRPTGPSEPASVPALHATVPRRLVSGSRPFAEAVHVRGGAVPQPPVELSLILELLTTQAGDGEEGASHFGERRHVDPELFPLRHGEDILLAVPPALLDVFDRDVGRHARRLRSNGRRDLVLVREIRARQSKHSEDLVDVDPAGVGVVVRQVERHVLVRQRESFDESQLAVHARKAAALILDAPRDDLEAQARPALEVQPEERGIDVRAQGVHVVHEEMLQLRTLRQQAGQYAVAQQIRKLEPMADGMQALARQVVGVVAALAGAARPPHQGVAKAVAHLLLLFVQQLLRGVLPEEPEVAQHRDQAQADGPAGREHQWPRIAVVLPLGEKRVDGIVGEPAGREDVRIDMPAVTARSVDSWRGGLR